MSEETKEQPMTRLEELQNASWRAAEKLRELESKRSSELYEATLEFKRKFEAEVLAPKYNEAIKAAKDECSKAHIAVRIEADRAALESAGEAEWPLGTRFVEWTMLRSWRTKPSTWTVVKDGPTAVLEVFTSTSLYPGNMRNSKPSVGTFILRVLKKDGTPSARFISSHRNWATGRIVFPGWFPDEGVDPNEKTSDAPPSGGNE